MRVSDCSAKTEAKTFSRIFPMLKAYKCLQKYKVGIIICAPQKKKTKLSSFLLCFLKASECFMGLFYSRYSGSFFLLSPNRSIKLWTTRHLFCAFASPNHTSSSAYFLAGLNAYDYHWFSTLIDHTRNNSSILLR